MLSLTPVAAATVEAKIYSSFLARGEKVLLEIKLEGIEPDNVPVFPKMEDVKIEAIGYGPSDMIPGRRIEYRFQYVVSSYAVGKHTIPEVEVMVGGVIHKTEPIRIEIFNPDDLAWNEVTSKPEAAAEKMRYASIIKIPNQKIYQNQTVHSEIKIYVPNRKQLF